LAMVFSVKKFCYYLICNPLVFFVDHMAIKFLVNKPELNGRLARWVLLLEKFDYTVDYKPGRITYKPIIYLGFRRKWDPHQSMMI
jgi:hypothetical protein